MLPKDLIGLTVSKNSKEWVDQRRTGTTKKLPQIMQFVQTFVYDVHNNAGEDNQLVETKIFTRATSIEEFSDWMDIIDLMNPGENFSAYYETVDGKINIIYTSKVLFLPRIQMH